MLGIISIFLVLAGIFIVMQARALRQSYLRFDDLARAHNKLVVDYAALDEGMDEQRESYEQDYLSMMDAIQSLKTRCVMLTGDKEELEETVRNLTQSVHLLNAELER